MGSDATTLILNSGSISYYLDPSGKIVKQQGEEINSLTDHQIRVEELIFSQLGPSTNSPTVKISFKIKGKDLASGRTREEIFQTAVTIP